MSKKIVGKLPHAEELKNKYSLTKEAQKKLKQHEKELSNIISWKDSRKILIIWPCSADFEESLYEYAQFLSELQKKVEDKIKIVMRFYTGKPRTVWGWKGLQNSNPWEEPNIITGIENSRKIAINIIEKYNLSLADELLQPQLISYFEDIFNYFAIWARSTENQYHREVASGLYIPVWMKNPTSWDIGLMCNSIKAGQTKSTFVVGDDVYKTTWNTLTHWILRWGASWPNYSLWDIVDSYDTTQTMKVENPSIIIDCNHDNSWKKPEKQIQILSEVMNSIEWQTELYSFVKWFMVESYLYDWRQDVEDFNTIKKGLSLTDPCIGKEATTKLIEQLYRLIK